MLSYGYGKGDATNREGSSQPLLGLRGRSIGAQARVLARWRAGDCCVGRTGGDRLALPPALLSRQLLVHGETFAAVQEVVVGAVPGWKRHREQGDEQAAGGDQTWDVA